MKHPSEKITITLDKTINPLVTSVNDLFKELSAAKKSMIEESGGHLKSNQITFKFVQRFDNPRHYCTDSPSTIYIDLCAEVTYDNENYRQEMIAYEKYLAKEKALKELQERQRLLDAGHYAARAKAKQESHVLRLANRLKRIVESEDSDEVKSNFINMILTNNKNK